MQSYPQATQISPDISQTASTYQLGNAVAEHGFAIGSKVGEALLGIFLVFGGCMAIIFGRSGAGLIFGGLCLLMGLLFCWDAWRSVQSNPVYTSTNGD